MPLIKLKIKCPVCKQKFPPESLSKPSLFGFNAVSAGQCPECKVDLDWVYSWKKGLLVGAALMMGLALGSIIGGLISGKETANVSVGFGGLILGLLIMGRKLAKKETPPKTD